MARKSKPSRHFTMRKRGAKVKDDKHLRKLHVRRDDIVEVISGAHKGARGKVLRAIPSDGMVVVEGINRKWKHLRRSQENPQGGRIEREYPIHACKVRKVEN